MRAFCAVAMLAALAPAADAQAIRGQVWAADGAPTAGLRVTVHAGAWADSASTDAEGRFSVPLPDSLDGDSVGVVVDAAETAARVFHPSVVLLARGEWDEEVRMILLPRRWTIRAGTHVGQIVEVSARRGFTPTCRGCSNGFFRRGVPSRLGARVSTVPAWRPGSFPLRVAFDHEYTSERISPRDSAAFWREVAELERDLGEHLFRPARFSETDPVDDAPEDLVLVWVERGLRSAGLGSVAYSGADIGYGSVRLDDALAFTRPGAPGLIAHEMVHTLGIGHTCSWYSVVADVSRCPERRAPSATPEDVAYVQVHLAMGSLQRAHGARWGLDAALRGEEEVENSPKPNTTLIRPSAQ
ncbi:MAG TPA: hypothetical protein VF584_01030 [Longimicrobium sp.]|jgi:hypothetical protein